MNKCFLRIAALAFVCLLFCTGCAGKSVSDDVSVLAGALKNSGRKVTYYERGSTMLEALDDEMDMNFDDPTENPLAAYLFAKDSESGTLDCEIFIFETDSDAEKLYAYLKGGDQFVEGESAIRRAGKVVYMGYIEALEVIEKTK